MANIRQLMIIAPLAAVSGLCSSASAHPGEGEEEAPPEAASVTARVRTGVGSCVYESVPNWCRIPQGRQRLGATHGAIVIDKAGNIYCSMDSGAHGILVYRPDGTPLRGIADGLAGIHGMCIREEGGEQWIYAADLRGGQVLKLSLQGALAWSIKGPPMESGKYPASQQYLPTAVAVGPEGDVYVADGYGANWIHQFDKDRKYVRSFGGPGKEQGQFQTCHGLALDTRGDRPLLLVCDRENRRLQHFNLDGTFVAVIAENLRRPCSVAFWGDRVAVAELEGRVTILDGSNRPIAHLGDNPDRSQWANYNVAVGDWREGIFTAPHGAAFDKDGNLYVMDWNASGRISRLDRLSE